MPLPKPCFKCGKRIFPRERFQTICGSCEAIRVKELKARLKARIKETGQRFLFAKRNIPKLRESFFGRPQ